jgi:hypothetical protein
MYARVTKFEGSLDKQDERIKLIKETVIPRAKELAGFKGGYWLVDRATGKGLGVTLFESDAALRGSEEGAAQLRSLASGMGVRFTGVEHYEVVAEAPVESDVPV